MFSRRFIKLAALCTIFVSGMVVAKGAPAVSLVADPAADGPAKYGAGQILAALRERQVSFEQAGTAEAATGQSLIMAAPVTSEIFSGEFFKTFRESVPTNAGALAIKKMVYQGKPVICVAGADGCGLMYGELELAEQTGWGTNAEAPFSEVRDTVEKPDVKTRGIILFVMNRAYWESRFYDTNYWDRYFDVLAQNRFNSITVTFGYEDGGFLAPCYPYFFDVPEFPEVRMVGISPAQQARNTAALNQLIAMAHARGIRFTAGIWDHIYRGGVQNGGAPGGNASLRQPSPDLVWGMNATNLIPYTQAALKIFLARFPGLDGIQFRMHDESGLKRSEQEQFWRSIFQTMMEAAPKMPLDLRAKGLTGEEIQSALAAGVNFHLSTKYWEEQMGLPFHPTHINPGDQGNARHSYAALLVYPQQYKIDWQLWNGGPARIFLWGDPDYARRFVATTHLYDGDSFEVDEPLATKMEAQPQEAKPFDLLKPAARYYDYEFERYWHFFQVFGRIGYDTNAASEIWDREFARRLGADAGPDLEKALHRASWILPRIIASSYPYSGFPMTVGWAEKQHLGDLPDFARATFSDVQLFENFDEEAELLITHGETAKTRPQETSRWFAQASEDINRQVDQAEKSIGSHRSKEFESTVLDLKLLADLALYHSRRIPAAVSYRLFERTQDPEALDAAIANERSAREAWRQMVDSAGDTYANDLRFGARSRDLCGNWRDELGSLDRGLVKLEAEKKNLPANGIFTTAPRYAAFTNEVVWPTVVHEPMVTAPLQKPITIRATVTSPVRIKWVQVLYRSVNQTKDYTVLDMKAVDSQGNFEAVIPADKMDPRYDLMYLIQAMDNQQHGVMYPISTRRRRIISCGLSGELGRSGVQGGWMPLLSRAG